MKNAESVVFGGSGLDRAAHLRSDLSAALSECPACTLVLWRGKLLVEACDGVHRLVRLGLDYPVLRADSADAPSGPFLLGRDSDGLILAHDISRWEPDPEQAADPKAFFDPSEQQHPGLPQGQVFSELRGIMSNLSPQDAELGATARALFEWHRIHGFCARCGEKSDVAQAGWQRNCPSCGGAHFPRTDPVVIMLITLGNSVLLGRSPGWPDGMYSLLAGFVEPGETIEAAVRREVFEEVGVHVGAVSYLASQPWPFPASLMIGCAGEATSEDIQIDPVEIEDAIWVSREQMLAVFAGEHQGIKQPRRGAIAHFLIENWMADCVEER